MNNNPSLNEINKTANKDPNLLTRHYKLKLMNDFMYIKYQNPQMKQSKISNHLNTSPSTIQRYRYFHYTELTQITPKNDQKSL